MISYDNNATTTSECWVFAGGRVPSRCFCPDPAPVSPLPTAHLLSFSEWTLCSTRLSDSSLSAYHSQQAIKCLRLINKKINFYETCLKQTTKIDWPDKILLCPLQPHTDTHPYSTAAYQRNEMCHIGLKRFEFVACVFCFSVANAARSSTGWRCDVYASTLKYCNAKRLRLLIGLCPAFACYIRVSDWSR